MVFHKGSIHGPLGLRGEALGSEESTREAPASTSLQRLAASFKVHA